MIRTVNALVYAVIREIQRREHYYSVAVESLLYLAGESVYPLGHLGKVTREKHTCLAVRKSCTFNSPAGLFRLSLCEYLLDESLVVLVLLCIFESFEYFLVVDEFVCFKRSYVVHI